MKRKRNWRNRCARRRGLRLLREPVETEEDKEWEREV